MNAHSNAPRALLAGVALVAAATLCFEVLLTRIFSVTLWYHFGFLAISMALLGTSAAAVSCFLFPERLAGPRHLEVMAGASLLFALLAPSAVAVHLGAELPSYDSPVAFYAAFGGQLGLLFLAFFASGLCISVALYRYAAEVGKVYCFDLVGASLGSLAVVPLLYTWSAPALVFAVSALACLAAFCLGRAAGARPIAQLLVLAGAFAFAVSTQGNDAWGLLQVRMVKSYQRGDFQRDASTPFFEKWSPLSRVAVVPSERFPPNAMLEVTNDAGAPTLMLAFDGDYSKLAHFKLDPVQAAHHLRHDAHVLVIGTGGGIDVLTALVFDQAKVTAVEINPVMVDVVTDYYADYIGRIFEDPRVSIHVQEGRNFVAGSSERYDIIQFMMIDSWGSGAAAGAYVFSENSLYTTEAIGDYLDHLEPGGILAMTRFLEWSEGLRLTNLFAEHLERRGLADVAERIAVIKKTRLTNRPIVTALLKNGVFSQEETATLVALARSTGAEILYAPHLAESQLSTRGSDGLFRLAVDPAAHRLSRREFLDSQRSDLSSPTDDHPFFFFTTRLRDALRPRPDQHAARRVAIPLLYGMACAFAVISALTIFLPLHLRSRAEIREAPFRTRSLCYFALLGAGFMLIEISLIQRLTVFLGHPTWSFVVVLATLLLSSGLGSLYSARWPEGSRAVLVRVLITIGVLAGLYAVAVYDPLIRWMALGRTSRIAVSVAIVGPAGFLMGMCFPLGIQLVRHFHPSFVAWGWGVNGAFSVFASILSIAIAIGWGFKSGLAAGAGCYAIAALIVWTLPSAPRDAAPPGRVGRRAEVR